MLGRIDHRHAVVEKRIHVGVVSALVVLMAGCSAPAIPPASPVASDVAARFVACLTSAGVDAQIGEGEGLLATGMVFVRSEYAAIEVEGRPGDVTMVSSDEASSDGSVLMQMSDDQGRHWIAVSGAALFERLDPDVHDAYAGCEAQIPDFTQPAFNPVDDPMFVRQLEEQRRAGLAFARCARDAGFNWVADPTEASGWSIELPTDLTEADFRGMLTACPADAAAGVTWMIDGDLGFDWLAVLDEVTGGQGGGGTVVHESAGPNR